MAKSSKSKRGDVSWIRSLNERLVREAFDEATIDAYGDDEQHTALLIAIEENLQFPFAANLLGRTVQVVGMQWPRGDGFGLDLIAESDGQRCRFDAQSFELKKPLPPGHLFLAAYLDWRRCF